MRKLYLLLGLLLPGIAIANEFKFYTYVDGSYNYLKNSNHFVSGDNDRVFDLEERGLALHQLALTLGYQPAEGFGGLVNIIAGTDTYIFAPYGFNPYFGSDTFGIDPTQVYLQYSRSGWTVIGGLYVSTCGAEVIDPTLNTNYSRSILDGFAEPFTFMGVRATYLINGQVNMIVGLNNGWDSIRDISRRKTSEIGFVYNVGPSFSIAMLEYNGVQRAADRTSEGPEGVRNLLDVVATWNYADYLSFVFNYDYGIQPNAALPNGIISKAVWQGTAGYINYKFNNAWQASLRGEIFEDKNGYRTGVVQTWKEVTLSLGYSPLQCLMIRAEARRDFSSADSFATLNGKGTSKTQQSFGLEAYFKYDY